MLLRPATLYAFKTQDLFTIQDITIQDIHDIQQASYPNMPRNALLSRNSQPGAGPSSTPQQPIPAIRFISATPSTHEPSEAQIEINMDAYPLPINPVAPFTATPLAPRTDTVASPRKRLVPKKSKLSLLSAGAKGLGKDKSKSKNKADDLSDVMRRVGAGSSRNGGFEIYVDQEEDASIVVVKKKKSRAALDNVGWGGNALGEVTNVGSSGNGKALGSKENKAGNTLKVPGKGDENQNSKWWNVSIGRGRKDSKNKENTQVRSKSKLHSQLITSRGLTVLLHNSSRALWQGGSRASRPLQLA